jgi:hypothetical protein
MISNLYFPITEFDAQDYRQRQAWYREFSLEELPVYPWNNRFYAVYGSILLVPGIQQLTVFDLTEDLQKPPLERHNLYLDSNSSVLDDPLVNQYTGEPHRLFKVLLQYLDEFWSIVARDATHIDPIYPRPNYFEGVLPIKLGSVTPEERRAVQQDLDEQSIFQIDMGATLSGYSG